MRKDIPKKAPVFKEYTMEQPYLIPPSFDELIPENHLVRVVNKIIEQMDIKSLIATYSGGGSSSYHPRMLLKVIVYAYTQKIYSSRQIAKALRENIHFMWLSGNNQPEYRTVARFRSSHLKECIDQVFAEVTLFLVENGLVKMENYFLDGTILEANANKYSWVWKKSTKRYKENLQKKVAALMTQIDEREEQEEKEYGKRDLEELGERAAITSEMVKEVAHEISEQLNELQDSEESAEKKALKKN